jgi:hypothetical protein
MFSYFLLRLKSAIERTWPRRLMDLKSGIEEIEDKQSWQISGLAIKRLTKKIQTRLTLGISYMENIYCNGRK